MSAVPFRPQSDGRSRSTRSHLGARYGVATSIILVAPLVMLLGVVFVFPVGKLLWAGFAVPRPTFEHYARLFHESLYLRILLRTLLIAGIVTLVTLMLGFPVAQALSRSRGGRAVFITVCVLLPLWTSVLIRSYAWIVLLQRNGLINNVLLGLGITSAPLRLLYTEGAVIAATSHILLPYMILPIYSALRSIQPDLGRAARNLGAGATQTFLHVTLPLSLPGIFAGCLMVFILALGFYVTPALVGGPSTLMISTLISQQVLELLDWPFAGALSGALLLVTLALVVAFRRVLSFGHEA